MISAPHASEVAHCVAGIGPLVSPGAGVLADLSGLPVSWLLGPGALLLAFLVRWRLPVGVSEGLFVAGLTSLLLHNYAAVSAARGKAILLSASLVGLAWMWLVVATWVERGAARAGPPGEAPSAARGVRIGLAQYVAVSCALLAVPALFWRGVSPPPTMALTIFLLLWLFAIAAWWAWRHPLARVGQMAAAAGALLAGTADLWLPWRSAGWTVSGILTVLGALALLVVLAGGWRTWKLRRNAWMNNPEDLLRPEPRRPLLNGTVVLLAALTGLGGMVWTSAPLTPLAVALASWACLNAGHRLGSVLCGGIGLALAGLALATVPTAWLPASPANALLGAAVAGMWWLWLGRFWGQQLDNERPWTTAGALIPATRLLGSCAAGAVALLASGWVMIGEIAAGPPRWTAYLALLALLGFASMLVRLAVDRNSVLATAAAVMVAVAVVVPAEEVLEEFGAHVSIGVLIALVAVGLAARVGPTGRRPATDWLVDACLGGLLPVAALHGAALTGRSRDAIVTVALITAGFGLALALRWARVGRPEPAPAPS